MPAATTSPSVRTVRQPSPSARTVSLLLTFCRLDVQGEVPTSGFLARPPFLALPWPRDRERDGRSLVSPPLHIGHWEYHPGGVAGRLKAEPQPSPTPGPATG